MVVEGGSSPNISEGKEERGKSKISLAAGPDGSPPLSPLTASGESTPKSPLTPPHVVTGMAQGDHTLSSLSPPLYCIINQQ